MVAEVTTPLPEAATDALIRAGAGKQGVLT
jgi:hypothetical protein